MRKFIDFLKSLSRNILFRKTVLHFSAFFAAIAIFSYLTTSNIITDAPARVVPPEYQAILTMNGQAQKPMAPIELEAALTNHSSSVQGLVFFTGTPSIVVLGDGFEKDRLVDKADTDEMRNLAKKANVPVYEKPSSLDTALAGRLPTWWWFVVFGFGFWLLRLLFARRENKEEHSRFRVIMEGTPVFMNGLRNVTGLNKRKFYSYLFISLVAVNASCFALKLYHNHELYVMPPEMESATRTQPWQAERLLNTHPEDIRRIAYVDELNAVYLAINSATPAPIKGPTGADESDGTVAPMGASPSLNRLGNVTGIGNATSPKPFLIERTTIFPNTAEGKKEYKAFILAVTDKKVETKQRAPLKDESYIGSLTNTGRFWLFALGILAAIVGMTMIACWSDWADEDSPETSSRMVGAGGRGGHGETSVEVRSEDRKTFADVAGCQEAIDELKVVQKKIRRPRLYKVFGAPVPSGVMLYGPPGTGKTLLARALAGEIGGHFEALSGSQFVEMYVGVGAKRVREAYTRARAAARRTGRISIIFIDEIDAIAKKRGNGDSGGDKEYEQTLNELLVQMNGFGNHGLVLTMAATNRLDILDEAILRPGRFDIKVKVPKPDKKGRAQIYGVYLKKLKIVMPAAADEEAGKAQYAKLLDDLARRSHDFSGAEIEGAIKNGATIAVERQFGEVTEDITDAQMEEYRSMAIITVGDLNEGVDKMAYGTQIKSRVRTDAERWATAVHECGHASVPTAEGGDPVNRITIVMTDKSLGLMDSSPEEGERYDWTDVQFMMRLRTMLAGRAAEKIILNKISTGASNDFERASQLARQMVGVYGMSREFGVKSLPLDQHGFPISKVGEILLDKFNQAWGKIVDEMEAATDAHIEKHRVQIEACATVLYEDETMTGDEFRRIWRENDPDAKAADATSKDAPGTADNAAAEVPSDVGQASPSSDSDSK